MSSKRKPLKAPRQSELIVLDDSSDEEEEQEQQYDESEEEEDGEVYYPKAPAKKPVKKKTGLLGTYVMSREEKLLNGVPVSDEEDEDSGDEDDDYEDGDASYGDGSRAFDHKRGRLTTAKKKKVTPKPVPKAKFRSQAAPKTKMVIKSKPAAEPVARSAGKKRARSVSESESRSESQSASQSGSESESDDDFQRRKTVARPPARRTPVTLTDRVRGGREVVKARAKASREEPLRAASKPQIARKLAPMKLVQAKRPAKKARHVASEDEYSSEEEEEEEEEESEESEHERRHAPSKRRVEIEILDDSVSESEEELRPPPPKKKTKVAPASRKSPAPLAQVTARKSVPKAQQRRPRSPSPSSSSSASPSPPPSPPPRQAASRPAASNSSRNRPQPESPVPAPSRRSRGVDTFANSLTLAEIQAQEREMAHFAAERKRLERQIQAVSSTGKVTSNSRRPPASSARSAKPKLARRLQRKDSISSISSSVSSSAGRSATSHGSKQSVKTLTKKKASSVPSYMPPPLRDGFATSHTPSVVTTVKSAMESSVSIAENVEQTPIAHNTTWRRLRFARAPMNLLPVASSSGSRHGCRLPFTYVAEPELHEFDSSLQKKSDMVTNTFQVKTEHRLVEENQQLVNMKAQAVISQTLPALEKCHKFRIAAMIKEMRDHLPWSSQPASPVGSTTPGSRTKRQLGPPLPHGAVDIAPIERVHAKRGHLKLSRPRGSPNEFNRLVGRVQYTQGIPMSAGGGDDSVFERAISPETVIELVNDITPMRRSCTWTSVKTNFHVDDNPILRYIPHLGDKARVNIDPKRYDSTTLDKEERIVIELDEDEDEAESSAVSGEPSLSERMEQWRLDTANLKVESSTSVDDEVKDYLLCKVIHECGDSNQVFKALKAIGGYAQPETDYDQIRKREGTIEKVTVQLAAFQETLTSYKEEECVDKTHKERVAEYLARLAEGSRHLTLGQVVGTKNNSTVSHRLSVPHQPLDSNYVLYPHGKGVRQKPEIEAVVDGYRSLFCRRCYTYDCEKHGIEHPRPSRRSDPVHPVVRKAGVGLLRAPAPADEKTKSNDTNGKDGVIELASSSSSEESEDDEEIENDDAQSVMSGSVEGEGDGDGEVASVRRSRRSQTQADSMASANLRVQGVIVQKERRKQQRKQAKQLQKLVRPVDDSEYLDDSYQTVVGPTMDVLLSPDPQATCSEHCWKSPSGSSDASISIPELSEIDQVMLRKLMAILGTNACVLSSLLRDPPSSDDASSAESKSPSTTSCAAIRRFIDQHKGASLSFPESPGGLNHNRHSKSNQRRHQSRSSAVLHSGNSELIRRTRMHRAQQDKVREHSYKPCDHDGVCDASCECNKRGHDCDSACCCSRDCANRNHGCKCAAGECRGKNCSCYVANRECHPDFCFSCGAHEAAVMEYDDNLKRVSADRVDICRNVNMLRGVHKKIGVAFSATHGWGAFVLEPVSKGEFVYEYTGALISDDEAERRGNIYDAMMVSYLFDINSDEVVDAMRKGNKIKFANHKPQKTANLETKILVVRGEHRIAMFAKWDLHVGEELFFDYGYTNETAPEWSQERAPHNIHYNGSDLDDDDDDDDDVQGLLGIVDVTRPSDNDDEDDDDDDEDA